MPLRSPIYLDSETLVALAEYHDLDVPRKMEVVEKQRNQRGGSGRFAILGVGEASGSSGRDVEYQNTYTLEPSEKATVSRIIDKLIQRDLVRGAEESASTGLAKDDLVELDGKFRITAASMAGKVFYLLHRLLADTDRDLLTLEDFDINDSDLAKQIKQIYLGNELLPVPLLLEVSGTPYEHKVYVNVRPDHFVDAASANHVEGDLRVLGSVAQLIDGGDEGFLSAEKWLLPGYEHMIRRLLMTDIDSQTKALIDQLGLDFPVEDVHAHITGPAVVVDAIALY